jgi:membrane-associated phospholipid phosphatase
MAVAVLCAVCVAAPARAQTVALETSAAADGAVVVVAALATLGGLLSAPEPEPTRWDDELLGVDRPLRGRWGPGAAHASDALLMTTLAAPTIVAVGGALDRGDPELGARALVYAEAHLLSLALHTWTKRLVGRPRAYTYGEGGEARRAAAGADAMASFYSGHAAAAFTSALAGSILIGARGEPDGVRAALWASGLGLAGATAMLRTRAGRHFYSDVIAGALVGGAIGVGVPLAHGAGPSIGATDVLAGVLGLVGGVTLAALWPFDVTDDDPSPALGVANVAFGPQGLSVSGRF